MKVITAGQPGTINFADFPEPVAGESDLLLSASACGICSTDLKFVRKGAVEPKFALGHEVAGKIIKASPDQDWQVGQRVVVVPYLPCGECYFCQHGKPALCERLYEVTIKPGGLAERILVPAELAKRGMFAIPDDMDDATAALSEPLGCVIKGLEDAHFKEGDSVLIVGDGSMGQLAGAASKALGSKMVIMSGVTQHRLERARGLFADVTVDFNAESLGDVVAGLTENRGADVVIVTVSSPEALLDGIIKVRPGGWVNAFAGVPQGTMVELDLHKLHYDQFFLTGSSGLAPGHMAKALLLLASQKVDFSKVITARFLFNQAAEAIDYGIKQVGLKPMITFE